MEEIVVIHTNDLHSHLEKWPQMRRYLLERQKQLVKAGKTVITLDLGDFSDRVHPLTEATAGQANTLLMNQGRYDLATIGNNEGIGNSASQLNQLYDQGEFKLILANLRDQRTADLPTWAQPYEVIETQGGTKLGFIGLTAPFPLTYNPNGWDILAADQVLPELIAEVGPQCDALVLMSHLGIEEETRIAQTYPEIAVILGSHTHHLLVDGLSVGETLLAAAGKFGRYIGEVALDFKDKQLVGKTASVQLTEELPVLPTDQAEIAGYLRVGHDLLEQQGLGCLPFSLSADPQAEQRLIDVCLEAIANYAQVEGALLNSGLFLETLAAGRVSKDDLHRCLPHPMHLVRVTLSGREMVSLVGELRSQQEALREFAIVGMGFRGKVFGELRSIGLSWGDEKDPILWQGRPLQPERRYSFVTVDHLMFIPFFPTIREKGQIEMLFPEFLRNVLGDYLEEYYPCP